MTAKCSMCHGSGIVTSQTICDCKKLMEPSTRDWKPVVGEKVLVEATVLRVDGEFYRCSVFDHYWRSMGDRSTDEVQLTFPLSSIRPIGA